MKKFYVFWSKEQWKAVVQVDRIFYYVEELRINVPTWGEYRNHPNDWCITGEAEVFDFRNVGGGSIIIS